MRLQRVTSTKDPDGGMNYIVNADDRNKNNMAPYYNLLAGQLQPAIPAPKTSPRDYNKEEHQKAIARANDYFEQQKATIDTLFETVSAHLRGLCYEALLYALAALRKHDSFHGEAAREFKGILEVLDGLNLFQDEAIETISAFFKEQLNEPCEDRDETEILRVIGACAAAVRSTVLTLSYEERQEREETFLVQRG